jgi:uncharacterized protein YdiU (UPF0061 family)
MGNNGSEAQPERIPSFIRRQLENPPVLPGESKSEFKILFREIEYSAEGGEKTAADYAVDYQAAVLIWNLQRIDRMMVAVIRHMHPAAVAALLRRSSRFGEAEPGSLAYETAHAEALAYFTSDADKKKVLERFAKAGYAPDAVEVEAFERALPQITNLNRQQNVARQQLLAFLKEIDLRNSRRAKELRKVADSVISGARASASKSGATT